MCVKQRRETVFKRKLQLEEREKSDGGEQIDSIEVHVCANVFSGRIEWCSLDYSLPMALLLTKRHWPNTHKNRPANDLALLDTQFRKA